MSDVSLDAITSMGAEGDILKCAFAACRAEDHSHVTVAAPVELTARCATEAAGPSAAALERS